MIYLEGFENVKKRHGALELVRNNKNSYLGKKWSELQFGRMRKLQEQYPACKPLDPSCKKSEAEDKEQVENQYLIVSRLFFGIILNRGLRHVAISLILADCCKFKPEPTRPW